MIMKLSSILLLVLSATPVVAAHRTSTPSLTRTLRRSDLRKQRRGLAFVKNDRMSWTNDARKVRGGEGGGTATMTNEIFNLIKGLVGVGVVGLPAGEFMQILIWKHSQMHDYD